MKYKLCPFCKKPMKGSMARRCRKCFEKKGVFRRVSQTLKK